MGGAAVSWLESKVAVIGLGTTGRAVMDALGQLGVRAVGFDLKAPEGFASFESGNQQFVIGGEVEQASALADDFGLVVVSPGVAPHSPVFQAARNLNLPVWSEVELAWQIQQHLGKDIAWLTVTGTNGKTTTVGLLGAILEADSERVRVVGNVGMPIVSVVMKEDVDVLAVELSSFQLYSTQSVEPVASVCLNVDADHLDWHGTVEEYAKAKARVYENTRVACVYDAADLVVENMVMQADVTEGARAIGYALDVPAVSQVGLAQDEDEVLIVDRAFVANRHTQAAALATLADVAHFAGPSPSAAIIKDTLAAIALARAYGAYSKKDIDSSAVVAGLRAFHPAGHRRQVIGEVADMIWIDDSKATNAHAAAASLSGFAPGTVIWIAGGDAKGQDFHSLVKAVAPALRGVVVIGADPTPITSALTDVAPQIPHVIVDGHEDWMYSVVNEAVALSRPGDTVVLAPAAASWDQFNSYAERGDVFREAVARLDEAWQIPQELPGD
ncbi:UDP-N-acetylmuramoyl-L-alanine--D-glutamate ligase [Actinomyces sp. S4-C9]|uniref:UDP-N-acetylmuramoyl-L-alanine--D-glutamate ligase n=1 Tax=Actinomyces sp. S4-C9 TaxID=1219581 RepID=UPI00050F3593|nr:UDP-N-acetylmuramoyl-L-alanine--D-glutamate ligase [Actinomyces sp. S4-C9]KGF00681.1 UDP-N-acetylmuramoyl-L-alanyl-D-glutamate synthetase [Actinomyces sp. S4-C9]